jgi:hypothetical protein
MRTLYRQCEIYERQGVELERSSLFRDGCPNLIWELNRARREQLSAQQLLTTNVSERIVDKDNHLRDCLKYLVLSLPAPADTPDLHWGAR